jgi:hypothetical protein
MAGKRVLKLIVQRSRATNNTNRILFFKLSKRLSRKNLRDKNVALLVREEESRNSLTSLRRRLWLALSTEVMKRTESQTGTY